MTRATIPFANVLVVRVGRRLLVGAGLVSLAAGCSDTMVTEGISSAIELSDSSSGTVIDAASVILREVAVKFVEGSRLRSRGGELTDPVDPETTRCFRPGDLHEGDA